MLWPLKLGFQVVEGMATDNLGTEMVVSRDLTPYYCKTAGGL